MPRKFPRAHRPFKFGGGAIVLRSHLHGLIPRKHVLLPGFVSAPDGSEVSLVRDSARCGHKYVKEKESGPECIVYPSTNPNEWSGLGRRCRRRRREGL